jgi:hypothetical protein
MAKKTSYMSFLGMARKKHKKITEDDPRWNPRTMGNHRGSKDTKTTPGANGQYRPT